MRIRLKKPGKSIKGRRHFQIAVMESWRARDSKAVEKIGYYDPARSLLEINTEKYENWIKQGAKPTETVASLYKRYKRNKIK